MTLNNALRRDYTLDEVPGQPRDPWDAGPTDLHRRWWEARIARQKEIDASIAAKADFEYLYDKPYEDRGIVRVAGPFTVESLAPHRTLGVDENDELIDHLAESKTGYDGRQDFATMILEHLNTSGVQQAHREDRISFTALTPWPGDLICAEGRYVEGDADTGTERRAGIFIGPEFGTVSRPDLVAAAREAADADFDVLIACAFSYEAHATEFSRLGRIPILKARMNADLHMAGDLKNTGKGNLFVIFGEPDIDIIPVQDNGTQAGQIQVKVNGVDVFHPNTGEIRSDGPDGIACWFVDTDYNEESFFVRHAYFLGANDPYKALKTTLKTEIHREAWETLHSDTSRPLRPPRVRPHRRQSNQPPRRRSNESLPRLSSAGECVAQWNNRCVSSSMRQIGATSTGRGFGSGRRGCDMNGVQRDAEGARQAPGQGPGAACRSAAPRRGDHSDDEGRTSVDSPCVCLAMLLSRARGILPGFL